MALLAGADDEITLNGRFMLYPPDEPPRPRCPGMPERPGHDFPAHETDGFLEPPGFTVGLGLRTANRKRPRGR